MTAPLHDSLLRFWRETNGSRSVVGTGFLADGADGQTYALTCAHVANLAMGRGAMSQDRAESGTITADLVGRGTTVTLDLVGWHPPVAVQAARGSDVADIAVFRPRPPFTPPFRPPLRIEPPGRVVPPGQRVAFHSFGFMGAQDGVATHGFLTAADAGGWFVADGDAAFRRFIDEGLSGAPVFANGRVLGMVVQRLERDAKQGLVIPALSIARAWPPLASPYPGLPAFDADTAHLFFGRGRPTTPGAAPTGTLRDVLDRLRSQRLVALMGASGSGKSSLAKAGVADAYRQDGWTVLTFRPGLAPLRNLAEAIATTVEGLGPGPQRLMAMDRWEQALAAGRLGEAVATAQGQGAAGVLIVVDQFEEFFTGQDAEAAEMARQRSVILPQIRGVVERGAAHALLTARLDLIESMVTGDSEAARLLSDPYPIFVLTGIAARDVREAIEGPAALFGVGTDPGFATNLAAAATREDGRLPLLQEALRQCWAGLEPPHSQGEPDGWCLRPPTGGGEDDGSADRLLEEALARRGAEALAGMRFDVVDVQRVLLSLVRLADGRATRRIVPLAEVGAEDRPILDRLADERLVILDGERGTAEIVHEALMVRWPQLAGWIDGQRAFLEWRERFEREFRAWEAGGREAKDVLRPHDLARALDWMQTPDRAYGRPTGKQSAFIDASRAVHAAESDAKDAQLQRTRRWLRVAVMALVLMAAAIGAGALAIKVAVEQTEFAQQQAKLAEEQARVAQERTETAQRQESRALAILAQQESARGDQGTALLLALEALPAPAFGAERPVSPEAAAALRQAWMRNRETTLVGHRAGVVAVAFSPDGRRAVTASDDKTARVWDLTGNTPTATVLEGHTGTVRTAAFSPDGRRVITASDDKTARVWDLAGDTHTPTVLVGHRDTVQAAAFSPDGHRVITASWDKTARVWELTGDTPTATVLVGHSGWVRAVAFSPDGRRVITASDDKTARVWELAEDTPTATVLKGHTGPVQAAAFSPDGRRAITASSDNTARVWELAGDAPTATLLEGHTGRVWAAAFSPDGRRVITASDDKTARVWELAGVTHTPTVLVGHTGQVLAAAFSPDGHRVITASWDKTARVWELTEDTHTATVLKGHTGWVREAAFSPDGRRVITASSDNTARVWELAGDTPIATVLKGHTGRVLAATFSPDGRRIITASDDYTARVWELSGVTSTTTVLKGHKGPVQAAAFSPDGRRAVTASDDTTARVWELAGDTPTATVLEGHMGWVLAAAFSPDGRRVVTAASDNTARVWELAGDTPTATVLEGHTGWVQAAAFSPDGRRAVTASNDGTVRVWKLAGDTPTATVLTGHTGWVRVAAFSPDGRRAVTASDDKTARVWELAGDTHTATVPPIATVLEGHTGWVLTAAFSPDGRQVVTASDDNTARVWDLAGNTPAATVLEGHKSRVRAAAFSPDGRRVITASNDTTARVWDVYPEIHELSALVRGRLTRCLSIAQRERFGLPVADRSRPRDTIPAPDAQGLCPR